MYDNPAPAPAPAPVAEGGEGGEQKPTDFGPAGTLFSATGATVDLGMHAAAHAAEGADDAIAASQAAQGAQLGGALGVVGGAMEVNDGLNEINEAQKNPDSTDAALQDAHGGLKIAAGGADVVGGGAAMLGIEGTVAEAGPVGAALGAGMMVGDALAPVVFSGDGNEKAKDGKYYGSCGNNAIDWVFGVGKYGAGRW
jgi:hypothetical protein